MNCLLYFLVELWVKAVDAVLCVFCDDLQFAVSCVTVTRARLLPFELEKAKEHTNNECTCNHQINTVGLKPRRTLHYYTTLLKPTC